ncbi:glycosyltransferase [Fulvimonas soli]|jgi:peptidoglycan/xylan/chitin deacetylase (PgdA/CDA1 family)/glycosyltransferase involved in cell wall biosynthesis|uniref:Cellulose synthase/poly-beta-1,6-N-acetylglucosamine synthase-like glycosyltransferase n=1 Tax=Fulvimonas soli TaxID=155197 RepID=A0A316IED7_9GAMM|nr:glycosyltransferase [Fulvimonas soli]PWK91997.1 cellulose synthase/poly-beta-1,6-N-acetylglucosamine synthase-like glycosyltransferase [Fulvimonas soli]TNY27391.1 polysaccharide deacetylase [Fulvimonas soli]
MQKKPIFFDPTGRRASHVSRLGLAIAVVSTLFALACAASLFVAPNLDTLRLGRHGHGLHALAGVKAAAPQLLKPAEKLAAEVRARQKQLHPPRQPAARSAPARTPPPSLDRPADRPLAIGFYVNWDDNSYPALKRALPSLDWVIPSWLSVSGPDMALHENIDSRALELIRRAKPSAPILPLLQNAANAQWDGAGLARLLADPARRRARISEIVGFLAAHRFQGVTVDFEELPAGAQKDLKAFLSELSDAFAPHGWGIVLSVPFDDPDWDYKGCADLADFELLMAYDQHWAGKDPGSIAGQDWFEQTLDRRMKELDPDQTIVALGSYGYDWAQGKAAEALTFQDAMDRASDAQAGIDFDGDSGNPHYSYSEDDGTVHQVWFLDGVTAYNQIHAADAYRPWGYAVWRLGSEDPSVWSLFGRPYGAPAPDGLRTIGQGEDIDIEGQGEILQIASAPSPGARTLEVDKDDGSIDDERYTALPSSYVIQRVGTAPRKIALTFDDGPDPEWTPQILDILKARHVPATFFIIGENAEMSPGLVQREVAEGHDVGNHSFTHPNMGDIPPGIVALELNATQRLFEALTGRSMRLFRAPYFGDAEPTTADELVPIRIAQKMGYIAVGLHIDPDDWQRLPADQVVDSVLSQVAHQSPDRQSRVVLLHDGGGERSQTVAALPRIIDGLRAQGYQFVTVSELAGLTRDQGMPPLPPGSLARWADRSVFLTLGWFGHFLRGLFLAAVCLGVARLLVLGGLAAINWFRDRRRRPAAMADEPLVSVLIPAYNEEKVIASSIRRILKSRHVRLEVIVVDDGSTDATAQVVRDAYANEPRVRLIRIPNGGKANAVNTALRASKGEVIVALDADTQFEPDTIARLVRWFADPKVGAVAGNAKVGNRVNLITMWQALEYVTAQNLERRALAALGTITVVPGAVGAWRRAALEWLGGFPGDTLAEDQDLTIAVQKAGYTALFDSAAVAWTEAPDTARGLARQRFRWAYGTLQCLWKHRGATFNPRYGALGLVALPQVWLFQIVFSVVSPLVDLLMLWQLVSTGIDYLQHRGQFNYDNLVKMGVFYAVFMAVDLAAGVLAFAMEKREKWSLLWWLVLQRFGYRQLMYYVVVRSVWTALRGPSVGWGKQERKATVKAGEEG